MYIRRKVFSLLQDETGEERYFSTTEFDLDVEEKVFAETDEEEGGLSTGAKIGLGVGGGLAATAAGILGAKYAGKGLKKGAEKLAKKAGEIEKAAKGKYWEGRYLKDSMTGKNAVARNPIKKEIKETEQAMAVLRKKANALETKAAKINKVADKLEAPANFIVEKSGKAYKFVGDKAKFVGDKAKKAGEFISEKAKKLKPAKKK